MQEEALREGYELEYPQLPDEKILNIEECKEVIEIMTMFEDILFSYNSLNEKSGITENEVTFHGFSCNTEALQCGYARHLNSMGRFTNLKGGVSNFNSHKNMLPTYRKMLKIWKKIEHEDNVLTHADLLKILDK